MGTPWITVKTFDSLFEAVEARDALRSQGILSFIPDENRVLKSVEEYPAVGQRFFSDGVELQVKFKDLAHARTVLALD